MNNKVSANVTQISTNGKSVDWIIVLFIVDINDVSCLVASIERLTNEMGGSRDGPELRIKLCVVLDWLEDGQHNCLLCY